ncbi:DUF4232 domain-containing protein [Streptomyces varsoviensis]|uniref:DUF4232 domain-containing protein n=1 Tax=Streptomyces varsoviensis TaxID=67373 RepID=A0ABR5IUS0_9ACTN|nr:DUF4232 domain-containing protein [Streptomyces varsoviensis]KOG76779.1 hypothetical protein ADK38_39665 [Streptomyces varsoviensis]
MSSATLVARRARRAAAVSLVAVAALSLSACGNDKDDNGAAANGSSSAASAGASGPDEASGSHSGTGSGSESAGTSAGGGGGHGKGTAAAPASNLSPRSASDRCAAADMSLRVGDADAGAGNIHYPLVFTNTGKKTCSLGGYPGVSLLAGDGQQVGSPAKREGGKGSVVRLAPGKSAYAALRTINDGLKDAPCWKTGKIVKAYAPGSKDAMTARTSGLRVCGDTFTVGALQPGTGPQG